MTARVRNEMRREAQMLARAMQRLFWAMPMPVGWVYRLLCRTENGETLRLPAQKVLADLNRFCRADKSSFDPDPLIMARREGRRDVWLRIINHLNLDADAVQQFMEIDDE